MRSLITRLSPRLPRESPTGFRPTAPRDSLARRYTLAANHAEEDSNLDTLIDCIFPNLNANMSSKDYITSRAILSTRNDWVDMIKYEDDMSFPRERDGVP